jgi:hypothetical protein
MGKHYKNGIFVYLNNQLTKIDKDLSKIVFILNLFGFETTSSCQKISSGTMAGLSWIRFKNYQNFNKLLEKCKLKNFSLFKFFCDQKHVLIIIRPTFIGNKVDVYFNPKFLLFLENGLIKIQKELKSKL